MKNMVNNGQAGLPHDASAVGDQAFTIGQPGPIAAAIVEVGGEVQAVHGVIQADMQWDGLAGDPVCIRQGLPGIQRMVLQCKGLIERSRFIDKKPFATRHALSASVSPDVERGTSRPGPC